MSHFVTRPWYAKWDALGNETGDVRWLRVGRGRWYVEVGKWGVYARFGVVHFSLHYDDAVEDDE